MPRHLVNQMQLSEMKQKNILKEKRREDKDT